MGRGYRGSVYGFGFGSPWLCYRHRFRSLGRSQFICHTRQSSLWSQSANGQAAASANHVGDNFVVPLAPSCWAPSPVTHTHTHTARENKARAKPANPMTKFISGFIVVQILGPNLLTKGGPTAQDRPGLCHLGHLTEKVSCRKTVRMRALSRYPRVSYTHCPHT